MINHKNERVMIFLLALFILSAGLLFGRWLGTTPTPTDLSAAESFRTWFWSHRSLDLGVQVCLIFAGALGVAAILPAPDEEES